MGCSSCGGAARTTEYQVLMPNGETKVFLTEIEARTYADQSGGTYNPITR